MGRGKIEIKRIENTSNRQVTYSKRRNGIIKKAKEITVLCDAQVSLIIFASSGKMVDYCSSNNLVDILDQYHKQSGKRLWDAKHENLNNEIDRVKKENDSMQLELRHLRGEDINSLNHKELMAMEDALEIGLANIRERQAELMKMLRKNLKMEEEENERLSFVLMQQERRQQEMALEENTREMEINEYHNNINNIRPQQQQQRDFNSHQLPFAFRVLPMQPNLQERM